ncbi:MAG TPA: oxygenase MpaB family protein [Acidimicrobiales bacterium]|nr:oxygenase MpaB family protein [Acidimicrobiales bacterium]
MVDVVSRVRERVEALPSSPTVKKLLSRKAAPYLEKLRAEGDPGAEALEKALVRADVFTDEFLEELRHRGDDEADQLAADYVDSELELTYGGLMGDLVRLPAESDDHADMVREFLNEPPELPDWHSPLLVKVGEEVFWRYFAQLGLGLWMGSIPSGYLAKRDAVALAENVRLISDDDARRRFLETGQFFHDVLSPGGLDPNGPGTTAIRLVRLIHAGARHLVKNYEELGDDQAEWKPELGEPINQMALLGVMCTFSVVGLQSLEVFGIRLTAEEEEAYVHTWCVVGHILGIDDDLLPLDLETAQFVWGRIKEREFGSSPEGYRLASTALDVMKGLIPFRVFDGFSATTVRRILGDEEADMLAIPPADWTNSIFNVIAATGRWADRFNRSSPAGNQFSAVMGRYAFRRFLELTREGERPGFQVADELKVRLTIQARTRKRARRIRAKGASLRSTVPQRVRERGGEVRRQVQERRRSR